MGTPLGPKYIPYTYMDPLGLIKDCYPRSQKLLGLEVLELPKGPRAQIIGFWGPNNRFLGPK